MSEFRRMMMTAIPEWKGLTFEALANGTTFRVYKSSNIEKLEYCTADDWTKQGNWTQVTATTQLTINVGQHYFWRSKLISNPDITVSSSDNHQLATPLCPRFRDGSTQSGKLKVKGDLSSIMIGGVDNYGFPNLRNAYYGIFMDCKTIVDAADLLFKAITMYCCEKMFMNCTNLASAPLVGVGNENINSAINSLYDSMFFGCLSLKELTIVCNYSGSYMFRYLCANCTSLKKVISHIKAKNAYEDFYRWMRGVPATGTFYNLGGYSFSSGESGIPSGWTVKTQLD